MSSHRNVCTRLLAVAASGLLLTVVGAQAGHAAASASAHPKGFFVTGQGRVTSTPNPSALVRDPNGGLHVITSVRSPSATGDRGHIVYITRQPGQKHWLSHPIPGLRPLAGIRVEEHLNFAGNRVFAVIYECDGIYAMDTTLKSSRMPEPSLMQPLDTCDHPGGATGGSAPPTARAVPLPSGGEIGVLLPDPAQDNRLAIFTGSPGSTFTPDTAIPTANGFAPKQMTIDQWSGRITIIGLGTDGTNVGIYDISRPWWEPTWTAPVRIATLNGTSNNYQIQSVVAYKSSVWVGLLKASNAGSHPRTGLYLVHGDSSGQWSGAIALPHSTSHDTALRLAINLTTNHLHAAFTRVNPVSHVKKSGIMTEARFDGRWHQPKFFTHWYRDYANQLTLTTKGHAVISYVQR